MRFHSVMGTAHRVVKSLALLTLGVSTVTCVASDDGDDAIDTSLQAVECVAKWTATWQQGSGANEWWVEYAIGGGTVTSAYLEVVGGANVPLAYRWSKWVGSSSARIPSGATVVVHAVNSLGEPTQTVPFRFLVDRAPATASCPPPPADAGTPPPDAGTDAGTDAGSGTCSAFRPTWAEGSGANNWWIEYTIGGGTIAAASLEVVGRGEVALRPAWGKWVGSTAMIATGANVIVHARSATGEVARTNVFRYLVDKTPVTAPCTPTSSGLDARPSNTGCVAPASPPGSATTMRFERVFPNVAPPEIMAIAQPPGDGSRWFVLGRGGKIWSFAATNPSATVTQIADFSAVSGKVVRTELSGGMLGFAFHPSFATNGRLYVTFTTTSGSSLASEVGYLTSTNGGQSFSSYTRVFGFNRAALEWNGGGIAFGKDGNLYLGFGASDTDGAQSKTTYFGKILRLDVDHPSGGRAYGIPAGNPFATSGGLPEIYAWGFRQPWRFSFDRVTGDLWSPDIGQASWEEIDRVEVGKNYGWPCREGAHDYASGDTSKCPSTSGLTNPVYEYSSSGGASAIGGYLYRGAAAPAFAGTYVFGDQVRRDAHAFRWDAQTGQVTSVPINEGGATIEYTSFAEDDAGEIYATGVFQTGIYKLVPQAGGTSTFPDRLSRTGCFDAADPKRTTSGVIPYRVNAPFWSDGLDKERGLGLPNGTTITVGADGDFTLPIGSVLTKTFSLAGKRIETRLFMRHANGAWAGYSYEWNDAQTDAFLLPDAKTKSIGDRNWTFPSRTDCMRCHTSAAGWTLGLELGQLNGDLTYPSTGRTANQLTTLESIGLFASALPASRPAYPAYDGSASVDARARSYLHVNCSGCHRPSGGAGRATMDVRFATPFASTGTCGALPLGEDIGVSGARILDPGSPDTSVLSIRVHRLDGFRMPPLGSQRIDTEGANLLDTWIRGIAACP